MYPAAVLWGLGPTVIGTLIFPAVSLIGFVVSLDARRNYLRDVSTGRIVRHRWRGESLGPAGGVACA